MSRRIERICIVGRDMDAWLTALALRRALGASVTVLELPSLLLPADVHAAVPAIASLHAMLGLDDRQVAARCNGVPMIAQRFSGWGRTAAPFLHAYDAPDPPGAGPAFIHRWLKGRGSGLAVALEDFSLAAAAAKQDRIPAREPRPGVPFPLPGWQLDAQRHVGLIKHLALEAGVAHRTGRTAIVERDEQGITAVRWDDGETHQADLFVDASAAEALLVRDAPAGAFESWREWLPADQILTASGPALRPLPAFSETIAFRGGWVGLHPLQDRTALVAAVSRDHADDQVLANLPAIAGVAMHGDAVMTPFHAGLRRTAWTGNCVAVGSAAAALEPLDSALLYLLHDNIAQLIEGISGSGDQAAADRYNRALAARAENIRDFQATHYRLNRRFDEPLWDRVRRASGPPSLDARIAQFKSAATIAVEPGEPFQDSNWTALFVGHGLIPESYDPRADEQPDEQAIAQVQGRLRAIAEAVAQMPTVEQYLAPRAGARPALNAQVS